MPPGFDEAFDAKGAVRPKYRASFWHFESYGMCELMRRLHLIEQVSRNQIGE